MRRDPVKGAKIAKKRQLKAKQAGKIGSDQTIQSRI
jgi:hypothetical protein